MSSPQLPAIHSFYKLSGSPLCPHGFKQSEIIGEGFVHALRVVDIHGHAEQGNQREAHGHAVVVVGVDAGVGGRVGRRAT